MMRRGIGLAMTTALLACTTEGELQRGTFQYECVLEEDSGCGSLNETSVPSSIAVGGRFRLTFEPYEGTGQHTVTPASTERAVADAMGDLTLLDDGAQALLAVNSSDNIVDFLLVNGAEVKDLWVSLDPGEGSPLGSIEIQQGVDTTLFARPVGADGQTLPGGFVFSWTLGDEGLALLTPSADSSAEVTINGQYEGSTQLTLSVDQLEV
ncbi:MAG TPA: hypothetical protein VFB62_28820, partial [Polyangiaceae bacterium]|nr:hypothetical protein [Polyangiaceae bacterium]